MTDSTFLVVGLGNPGPTYEFTRHRAEVATLTLPGPQPVKLVLAKPTTYMNDSGTAVRALATFHKIPADRVIAIHDELDLDPGRLRVKQGGGDNGHNGLKSLRAHLGTGDFFRVRVGIGRPPGRQSAADYVLNKLKPAQVEEMRVDASAAADAVESLVREGLVATQNRFNG